MSESNDISSQTHGARIQRMQAAKDKLKQEKRMLKDDLVRFVMNEFWLSRRVAEYYVTDLCADPQIKIVTTESGEYIEYHEGA